MSPRILIFSMAMVADYAFELISIETYAPQFIGLNKYFLGSVILSTGSFAAWYVDYYKETNNRGVQIKVFVE